MVDSKISDLTELTTVADGDLIAIVDDPSVTPITKKITKANLVKDIPLATAVTGTLAITNGGTSGTTATAAFDALSPVTTRGDIIIRDASNNVRLAVGTTGQVLTTDGTDVSWGTPSAGGASFTFSKDINGSIYTGNLGYFVVPDELDTKLIKEVRCSVLGLPTGADITVDIRKNGTASTDSIFTSDVPQDIGTGESATNGIYQTGCDTSGATVGTPGTTIDSARDDLAADDVLYIWVTQVGSTLTGADLKVEVIIG